jgi:sugar phosphate isomerase/epimerase
VSNLELCNQSMRRANLIELAEAAAGAGFAYITTTGWLAFGAPLSGNALRKRIDDCGVKVTVVEGIGAVLPGMPEPRPDQPSLDDCLRLATLLGAQRLNVVHMNGTPQPIELFAEAFGKVCRRAAEDGIGVMIEFVPSYGIGDLQTALAVVRAAGEPNGGILFDSWHFARCGGKLDELDAEACKLITGLQLADRTPDQDLVPHVPMKGRKVPGQGALPLARMTAPIMAAHPGIPIGAEIISDEMEGMDFDEAARTTAEGLRQVLSEAEALLAV